MDNLRGQFEESSDPSVDAYDVDSGIDENAGDPPPPGIGQDERRMQVRAYNFWASLLDDCSLPSIEDLQPEDQADFGPFSVLLDFTSGIENPAVAYLGGKLASECGTEGPIRRLDDVPSRSLLSRITDHYLQILANQAPIGFEAEFTNQRGMTILYRGILLPFSSDDETIDFIYGVINWKELADARTADELMLEIDQALEASDLADREDGPMADWADSPDGDDDVLDLETPFDGDEHEPLEMPEPQFTVDNIPSPLASTPQPESEAPVEPDVDEGDDEDEDSALASEYDEFDEDYDEEGEDDEIGSALPRPSFADYSIDDEDFDEYGEEEDADEINDTGFASLANIGPGSRRGTASPAAISFEEPDYDEDALDEAADAAAQPAIPSAYEPEVFEPEDEAEAEVGEDDGDEAEEALAEEPVLEESAEVTDETGDAPAPDASPSSLDLVADSVEAQDEASFDLADWLASARDYADTLRDSEERSRQALYNAVGRAHDFALAAAAQPDDFAVLMEDAGLEPSERSPFTPVVKLVFGVGYDKTRLAEFAAVLAWADRKDIACGELADAIASTTGGLKAIVAEERRQRRGDDASEPAARTQPRKGLASKLRKLEPQSLADVAAEGEEFTMLLARRLPSGEVVVLGEVAEDVKMIEKAARILLG